MSSTVYQNDLPVLVGSEDLPIPVADAAPQQEQTKDKAFLEWSNIASQRHVRHLAFDPAQGDVWLATGGGVLHWKLEANLFVRYTSEHGLPGNSVFFVAVDGTGQVWAACENLGIYYLKNDIWRFYSILGEVKVSCLTLDSTGRLWAGTASGIYAITTPDCKPAIELPTPGFPPRAIAINNENDIWLCNATGVHHYIDSDWMPTGNGVQPDILTLALQGENLWLGTFRGLVRVDLTTKQQYKIDTIPYREVTALALHPQGVWVACGGQVGLATETNWTPLGEKRLNATITSLAAGSEGEVWIGTHNGLLRGENQEIRLHLTETPPDVIGSSERFFSNLVQALSVQNLADRSILWIGTARGLFRYDLCTENWRRNGHFATQDIRAIVTSQNQENICVASWSHGLHLLKEKAAPEKVSNISEPVLALSSALGSELCAVGLDGVYHYNGTAWVKVISTTELPVRGFLQAVTQVVKDSVWLGTSAGLLLYKPGNKQPSTVSGNLGSTNVRSLLAIFKDNLELVFVGTSQGLYVGNSDNWSAINNLENRTITALAWDDNASSLWVGSDKGLFRLVAQGKNWNLVNEFNIHNSGLAANRVIALTISNGDNGDKKLWIGTSCGLSSYVY
jgi:ligand-binding sensor domain-containing protein